MSQRPNASLGRRLLPALAMTTAASGLVALLDQPTSGAAVDAVDVGDVGDFPTSTTAQPTGEVVADQPPPVSSTAPSVPASTSATCAGQTIDGDTIETRWGPVQVEAVVSATGQICDVDAIQSPDAHGRSVRINDQALPILHTEVMDAQSADIDVVSGATITTRGYVQSLQSILDGAG